MFVQAKKSAKKKAKAAEEAAGLIAQPPDVKGVDSEIKEALKKEQPVKAKSHCGCW